MEYRISDHAAKRMKQRRVLPEWVTAALENPDSIENDQEDPNLVHARKAIPDRGFKILRVIYNETTEPITVVTVYFE